MSLNLGESAALYEQVMICVQGEVVAMTPGEARLFTEGLNGNYLPKVTQAVDSTLQRAKGLST